MSLSRLEQTPNALTSELVSNNFCGRLTARIQLPTMLPKKEEEWYEQSCNIPHGHHFAETCTSLSVTSFIVAGQLTVDTLHEEKCIKIFIQHNNPEVENIQVIQENA